MSPSRPPSFSPFWGFSRGTGNCRLHLVIAGGDKTVDISTLIFQCACESEGALWCWLCKLTRSVYIYIYIYTYTHSVPALINVIENIHVLQRIHQFTLVGGHWVLTLKFSFPAAGLDLVVRLFSWKGVYILTDRRHFRVYFSLARLSVQEMTQIVCALLLWWHQIGASYLSHCFLFACLFLLRTFFTLYICGKIVWLCFGKAKAAALCMR